MSSATGYVIDKWSRNIVYELYKRKYDDQMGESRSFSFLSFFKFILFAYITYLEN